MRKKYISIVCFIVMIFALCACEKKEDIYVIEENAVASDETCEKESTAADMKNNSNEMEAITQETAETITVQIPSKEEVEAARKLALEGMTEDEINRLMENIKVSNQTMENAYLNDNLFEELSDKDSLYWNYIYQKGEIQIGWSYDGTYKERTEICKKENLTIEEFYKKYGEPVTTYNRFDADNFIALMQDMKGIVSNTEMLNCLEQLIQYMEDAKRTQEMEPINDIYKLLHDLDYYLLRYGPEDVAKYVQDASLIYTYYGTLPFYE